MSKSERFRTVLESQKKRHNATRWCSKILEYKILEASSKDVFSRRRNVKKNH